MTVALDTCLPHALATAVCRLGQSAASVCEQCRQSLALSALALPSGFRRDHANEAHLVLTRAGALFQTEFTRALDERVRREWAPHALAAGGRASSWDTWSLVDDRELDRQVDAERFGRTIGLGCEWELRELCGFLQAVSGSRPPALREDRLGLLRPEIIGHAVLCALDALPASTEVRALLAAELATTWAAHLPRTYAAIIGDLRSAGLAPSPMGLRGAGQAPARPPAPVRMPAIVPPPPAPRPAAAGGQADAGLTQLLRTWTQAAEVAGKPAAPPGPSEDGGGAPAYADAPHAPNLIRAHRQELVRALPTAMDHLIIDVVAALFEHILCDDGVPPAVAQQIGRLQLPVLRTALSDPSFFTSRRHPVRQLINRLASLALSLDDLDASAAADLVRRIRDLVHEIVHGDFEQLPLYQRTLADLEQFVVEMGRREVEQHGAAPGMLAERESDLMSRLQVARRLRAELQPLPAPGFLRDFIADVWSHVLAQRAQAAGVDGEGASKALRVARDLFVSVQPKGTPEQRREFVATLPHLIRDVTAGLDEIAWPPDQRHAFFGQLLPAHAQSLRGEGMAVLDLNLLVRQLDQALHSALAQPRPADGRVASAPLPLDTASAPLLSTTEASTLGLLSEDEVDWTAAPQQTDAGRPAAIAASDLAFEGLPQPEPPEPTQGRALADHVQVGFVYQMHLDGSWHQVRLLHVSPGRGFFVFARGRRHRRMVSLTQRMLVRLCEAGRFRALESAYLLERATARARQQLGSLSRASSVHA